MSQHTNADSFKKQFWENPKVMDERSEQYLGFYAQDLINRAKVDEFSEEKLTHVLDLCTGTGLVAFKLYNVTKDMECRVCIEAIDYSPHLIKYAKEKRDFLGANSVNFQEMDGQDLKFTSNSFDLIFSNVGVCFYPDHVKGFEELHRVLKRGGRAFINVWSQDYPMSIPHQIAHNHGTTQGANMNFLRLSNPETLKELLQKSGFHHISIERVPFVIRVKYGEFIETLKNNPSFANEMVLLDIAQTFNIKDDNDMIELDTAVLVVSLIKD